MKSKTLRILNFDIGLLKVTFMLVGKTPLESVGVKIISAIPARILTSLFNLKGPGPSLFSPSPRVLAITATGIFSEQSLKSKW